MLLPENLIANADDFGLRQSVNKAILSCYELGVINSTSLMANQSGFDEAVDIIHSNKFIKNVGVHLNFADGKPLSDFYNKDYLNADGYWDLQKTGKKINFINAQTRNLFYAEIEAQANRVMSSGVKINHIDSHHHLHTLPCFYSLFLQAAKQYKIKLRLAQTYNEGNYLKFLYRNYLNREIKKAQINHSALFETVDYFITHYVNQKPLPIIEVMLHPDLDNTGKLIDHYSALAMDTWKLFLEHNNLEK